MTIADVVTTRAALRRSVLDDLVERCKAAAVPIEGGPLDGVEVVSLGTLGEQVRAALDVDLPPASERHAEVITPATIVVSAICPECGYPVEIIVNLVPSLTVDNDGAELSVKAKSKARVHVHGQLSLPSDADGQIGMDDLVIDDLRLRILRAVYDVGAERVAEHEPGPPPTLDVIAQRLELATENDRGDLEDSLYRYAEGDEALVTILSVKGHPPEYALTEAGETLVLGAEADAKSSDDQESPDGDEPE